MAAKAGIMKCGRCGRDARLEGVEHCGQCLEKVVERRARKEMAKAFAVDGKWQAKARVARVAIACTGTNSLQCAAGAYLAKKALGALGSGAEVEIASAYTGSLAKAAKEGKTAITARCADETAEELIRWLTGKAGKTPPVPEQRSFGLAKAPNILESTTERELEHYADMKRIKYAKAKRSRLRQSLTELQASYPGTIEALARSATRIKEWTGEPSEG